MAFSLREKLNNGVLSVDKLIKRVEDSSKSEITIESVIKEREYLLEELLLLRSSLNVDIE